jgi:16S rRNA C967 or C1407 C5-methylase (RsmB/RsmF family)/NOL1/NOP2/fmu family ribosome biogenesis protein
MERSPSGRITFAAMDLPIAFRQQMEAQLGGEADVFLASLSEPPPVSIRLHPHKAGETFRDSEPAPWCPAGRYLPSRPVFTLDPAFHAGAYYVQEASSMLIGALVRSLPSSGPKAVLDLCAAPGGKSTHLLDHLDPDSLLVSNEIHPRRFQTLRENSIRWGYANQALTRSAPRDLARIWPGRFDLILVDAPCSGEGLFRKDPGAVTHWSPEAVARSASRQREILGEAINLLAPGGWLIYSTCTYNVSENDDQIRWLQDDHGFSLHLPVIPDHWGVRVNDRGWRCLPHWFRGEGFFCSLLRKVNDGPDRPEITGTCRSGTVHSSQDGKAIQGIRSFLKEADRFAFCADRNGQWSALPAESSARYGDILESRAVIQAGLTLGMYKTPDRFVPDHALALSHEVSAQVPVWELDRDAALAFLRKETLRTALPEPGLYRVSHCGAGLGWARVLPNRVNNLIPHHWRIRMQDRGNTPD